MDIVFPDGNEKELIQMARQLGWNKLCLVYSMPRDISVIKTDIKLFSGILIDGRDAKRYKGNADYVFVRGPDVRNVLEQRCADILFDLETSDRADFIHHRNSGLNQVICKLAVDRGVSLAVSISSVRKINGKQRSQFIGRTMQNIRFAKKYKIPVLIASFAKHPFEMRLRSDVIAFGRVLGMASKPF